MTTAILAGIIAALLIFVVMCAGAAADDFLDNGNKRAFTVNVSIGFVLGAVVFGLGWLAGVAP